MQDGGDNVSKGTNRIVFPHREKVSLKDSLSKMGDVIKYNDDTVK